jgi:hypothetical protein
MRYHSIYAVCFCFAAKALKIFIKKVSHPERIEVAHFENYILMLYL